VDLGRFAEGLRNGRAFDDQWRVRRASDGDFRWLLVRARPIAHRGPASAMHGSC